MNDLVQWLRAQLDEDQRIADAARGRGKGRWSHETAYPNGYVYDENGQPVVYDESAPLPEEAAHIAAHDPARVLRDIEAKREVIRLARAAHDYHETFTSGFAAKLEGVLRLYAVAYEDRPGFQEAWRP